MNSLARYRLTLLLAAPLVGCFGAADTSEDPTSTNVGALNGTIIWGESVTNDNSHCTAAQKARIASAYYSILMPQVTASPSPLRACMAQQVLSPAGASFAEEVVRRLAQNLPTHVYCDAVGADATGPLSIAWEEVHFSSAAALSYSPRRLASTMVRELARNKGYEHTAIPADGSANNGEYNHSVGEQLAHCVARNDGGSATDVDGDRLPWPQRRDEMPLESELQPFGDLYSRNETVTWPTLTCPTGTWGAGLGVCLAAGNPAAPNGFTLRCRSRNSTVNIDQGSCASPTWRTCPTDYVAVGVHGAARALSLDSLGLLCRRWSDLSSSAPPAPLKLTASGFTSSTPGDTSVLVERVCPAGQVLRSISGATQGTLESVRVVCQRPDYTQLRGYVDLAPMGAPAVNAIARMRQRGFCSDQGIVTGLIGHRGAEGNLRRLGAVCRGAEYSAVGLRFRPQAAEHAIAAGPGSVLAGDTEFGVSPSGAVRCPTDQGVVGVRIVRGGPDNAPLHLQGICAPIRFWMTGNPATTNVTFAGDSAAFTASATETAQCANGSFLAGLEVRGMRAWGLLYSVERIVPICRDFRKEQ